MKKMLLLLIVMQFVIIEDVLSQGEDEIRVAFWNMENFFDPFVDSTMSYNEYSPDGSMCWNMSRFYKKRNNIYRTILALSGGKTLAILGMCEVENSFVTAMLFSETPLRRYNYRCVHYDGPDRRGIDVALAYSVDKLQLVYSRAFAVEDENNSGFRTRDILYAKFYDRKNDTLHCFVNHWPSRYGGEKETVYHRCIAANILKDKIDSLIDVSPVFPKIVIMGDFNDSPYDKSISKVLKAVPYNVVTEKDTLANLFYNAETLGFDGTLKHKYNWQIFDQIIVSGSLLYDRMSLRYKEKSASIFHADFLFIDDETYGGKKLFRTYIGPKYQGGYSDHLPVYVDFINDE